MKWDLPRGREVIRHWCRPDPRPLPSPAPRDRLWWERLLHRSYREGVAGLVHRALQRDPESRAGAPESVQATFGRIAAAQAAAGAVQRQALLDLATRLRSWGIEPVVVRGHALVSGLYGDDLSLRPQVDLDLLVDAPCVDEAASVLLEAGFRRPPGAQWVFQDGSLLVDLHADLFGRERIPERAEVVRLSAEECLRAAKPWVVDGVRLRTLCPEHHLLLVAWHAVKHSLDRLIRLVDLAVMCRRYEGSWMRLEASAARAGLLGSLELGLRAVDALFGVPLPATWRRRPLARTGPATGWLFRRALRGRPSPGLAEAHLLENLRGAGSRARAAYHLFAPLGEGGSAGPLSRLRRLPRRAAEALRQAGALKEAAS